MSHSLINSSGAAPKQAQFLFDVRTLRLWRWTLLAAPLWWILGLNLLIYQTIALILFVRTLFFLHRCNRGIYLPASSVFVFALIVIYFFSILIHAQFFPATRVIAAIYNLTYWLMGFCIMLVLANSFSAAKIDLFLSSFIPIGWMMGVLGLLMSVVAWLGGHAVMFPTPLYSLSRYFENADLLPQSLTVNLLIEDWFASIFRLRFNAFSPYPTATGGVLMLTLMMIITRAALKRKIKTFLFIFLFILSFYAMLITLSRMSVAVFLLSVVIVFMLQKKRILPSVFFLACVLAIAGPWIVKATDVIWGLRQDSSETRFALYRYSLEQLHGIQWVLGLGIKSRGDAFIFPIGSHSTYVSLCVRTGIVGLFTYVFFQIFLFLRWYHLRAYVTHKRTVFLFWRGLGWVLIAMMIWTMTEDIDAPQLVSFLYFSIIGVFEGLRRELLRR